MTKREIGEVRSAPCGEGVAEGGGRRRFGGSGGSGIDDGAMKDPMEAEVALDERRSARNVTHLQVLIVLRKNVRL